MFPQFLGIIIFTEASIRKIMRGFKTEQVLAVFNSIELE